MRLLLPTFFLVHFLSAQNLVINPGFEESTSEKSGVLGISGVEGWTMPSDGTSDYYVITPKFRKEYADAPAPGSRSVIPFEGDACVGYFSLAGAHEYICGSFTSPLAEDSVYTISFAVSTLANMEFADGRIGVYFTDDENPHYREKGMPRLSWKPQVTIDSSQLVEETGYWKIYTTTYRAKGGERSFVIGDFSDTFDKDPRLTTQATYFYMDSVYIGLAERDDPPEETEEDSDIVSIETPIPMVEEEVAVSEVVVAAEDTFIAAGRTLVLENIYFETNKSRILPESYQPLYDIIIELKLQPDLKVEIVGHTDKHGTVADNQKLSEQRAQAVKDFFVSKGIDASRITTRGYGSSRPVGDNDQKNRRVEFIFTE